MVFGARDQFMNEAVIQSGCRGKTNLESSDVMSIFSFYPVIILRAYICLLYTSPSPRDLSTSRMPSSA